MKLVFCERRVLECWATFEVSRRTGRRIQPESRGRIESNSETLTALRAEGLKPACTIACASDAVTWFYKGDLPYTGDVTGFPVRKSLAREGASVIWESAELLSPDANHFRRARELWFAYCHKDSRESYAQFSDYVDAAMIISPGAHEITHVAVTHRHIPFILNRAGAKTVIQHFRS